MHCNDFDPNTKVPVLVTACLDRLDLKHPVTLNLGCDLQLSGQVSWASKSSVQIDINLYPKGESEDVTKQQQLTASMVFVHVQNGKAAPVNQINPQTHQDRQLFAAGTEANERRKLERSTSLKSRAPTPDESEKLHRAMLAGFGQVP